MLRLAAVIEAIQWREAPDSCIVADDGMACEGRDGASFVLKSRGFDTGEGRLREERGPVGP